MVENKKERQEEGKCEHNVQGWRTTLETRQYIMQLWLMYRASGVVYS